jgi:lipopolysaccharide export system protein LptC
MTTTPLPVMGDAAIPASTSRSGRRVGTASIRQASSPERLQRRRHLVGLSKRLLPLLALALLGSIGLWPELARDTERARLAFQRGRIDAENGQIVDPHYNGVDERGRPYTVTAKTARQVSAERINLVDPKGDIRLESGSWLMVQSRKGVFIQHANQLDLSDDVVLYRDDGTRMETSAAAVDTKAGAAAGDQMVHIEGPFGTLDAQGFVMTDRGTAMNFSGPGRLVMNGGRH